MSVVASAGTFFRVSVWGIGISERMRVLPSQRVLGFAVTTSEMGGFVMTSYITIKETP